MRVASLAFLASLLVASGGGSAVAAQVVSLPHGARLIVPGRSLSHGARVVARQRGSKGVALRVVGGRVIGPLQLRFPFHRRVHTGGMPLDLTVQVRFRNPVSHVWSAVPTHVDLRRHRVTATISPQDWARASLTLGGIGGAGGRGGSTWWNPFSWDWGSISLRLDQRVGELRGGRTGPAHCSSGVGVPSWADVNTNNAADLPLRTCAEGQGDKTVVQIVNNRPYGVILTYGTGVSWGWHELPGEVAGNLGTAFADKLVSPHELYIAPLKAASVGVPPGPFGFALFQAAITKKSLAADVMALAVNGLDTSVIRPAVLGSLASSCSSMLKLGVDGSPQINATDLIGNVRAIAGCLADAAPKLASQGLLDGAKVDTLQHSLTLLRRVGIAAEAAKIAGDLGDLYVGSRADMQANATFTVRSKIAKTSPTQNTSPPTNQTPTQTPGGSTPPPTGGPWNETTGGVAHTWTNYANAGGTQGPSIAANQTVQIACKITGFQVADGNTWWYRIASAPWNNAYYVSADAFYNNGATSGSLVGTPFYDPAVANC